ncbi:hypothetical protein [Methanosarcina siciliae]|uniref:hypothetical protein n=1 Tax=Methanosarcina siciliae TaxID=38027 RepID=UPI00064FE1BB|nr:hypothetical protein [Methanosarcina siciliae]
MSKEEILSRVLDILELFKPDMSEFNNRLKFQKIIYLLQSSGLSLGYAFNWYVRGPYSPDLAQSLFSIDDSIFQKSKEIRFKDHETIVQKLNEFRGKLGPKFDDVEYLEVLASMHYIWKVTFDGNVDKQKLRERLLLAKPSLYDFSNINQLIDNAYDDLTNYN